MPHLLHAPLLSSPDRLDIFASNMMLAAVEYTSVVRVCVSELRTAIPRQAYLARY